jgi:hypothetical protein
MAAMEAVVQEKSAGEKLLELTLHQHEEESKQQKVRQRCSR